MRKLATLGIVFMLSSSLAFADCKEMYKKHKAVAGSKAVLSSTGGPALTGGGVFVFYVGLVAGILGTNSAFIVTGAVAGGATTTGGVLVSISGVKNNKDFLQKYKAYKLIKESYIGAGEYLNKVAESLSEDLGKDITAEEVAAIVVAGDTAGLYCVDKDSLFGISDIKAEIANQF